jgi:hypothetical protein
MDNNRTYYDPLGLGLYLVDLGMKYLTQPSNIGELEGGIVTTHFKINIQIDNQFVSNNRYRLKINKQGSEFFQYFEVINSQVNGRSNLDTTFEIRLIDTVDTTESYAPKVFTFTTGNTDGLTELSVNYTTLSFFVGSRAWTNMVNDFDTYKDVQYLPANVELLPVAYTNSTIGGCTARNGNVHWFYNVDQAALVVASLVTTDLTMQTPATVLAHVPTNGVMKGNNFQNVCISFDNKIMTVTQVNDASASTARLAIVDIGTRQFSQADFNTANFASNAMCNGPDGNIYIFPNSTTPNCMFKYDTVNHQLTKITDAGYLNLAYVNAQLHPDGYIYLFTASYTNYWKYNVASSTISQYNFPAIASSARPLSAHIDMQGRIVMLTSGMALYTIDPVTNTLVTGSITTPSVV